MFDRKRFERDVDILMATAKGCGLDFLAVDFLVCRPEILSFVAAYSLPTRFPHWGFGKRFKRLQLQHRHGLARIHELVCFSDPCQAFLSENNSRVENMLVAAHVIAHCDFFKNNANFTAISKDSLELMAQNNDFVQWCIRLYGLEAVEQILDAALGLRFYTDLLRFISRNGEYLKPWQKLLVTMVCEESNYFLPLLKTRLLNEGWAAYWHTRLMREIDLEEKEAVEFAIINAEALDTDRGNLNPYRVGVDIFSHISDTLGDEALFAIRREESDFSFFQRHTGVELIEQLNLGAYSCTGGEVSNLQAEPKMIKEYLLRSLDNCGLPRIKVNKEGTSGSKLFLQHEFDGRPLDVYSTRKTLEHVYNLWGESVLLGTRSQGKEATFVFNGTSHWTIAP